MWELFAVIPNLGLSPDDRNRFTAEITHCISSSLAACEDFDLPAADAGNANITFALAVLHLAKECSKLSCFTHCSTAYVMLSNESNSPIHEEHVTAFSDGAGSDVYKRIKQGNLLLVTLG